VVASKTPSAPIDRKGLLARIPAFPPIVLRLLDMLGRDDTEIPDLVELISSDPAFSAQILSVANSPLFGFRSQVASLQSALVLLGLRRVRALTMTVATANHMKGVLHIEELSRCWRHMLACALLTEELALACAMRDERAYTAGLLHDVGRLGLLLAYPKEYAELLRNAERTALGLLDCERQALGMDHCEAGRLLAEHWNLPADFQIIAGRHHDPQANFEPDLLSLVHLACQLADSLGFWAVEPLQPNSPEQIVAALPPLMRNRLHVDADRWRETVERRILAYQDVDAAPRSSGALSLVSEPEPTPRVEQTGKARPEDPYAPPSLLRELSQVIALSLLATLLIVVIVYFSVK